jgi:hypothetical protein
MAADPRQFVLLAIALAVPAVAFLLGRSRMVLAWVAFTLFVQIFDTSIVTNLPAGRLVGLLFLPALARQFRRWSRLPVARAWLVNFVYLIALGVLFGFLMPWPDISGTRPLSLRAEGRTVIYLIRTLSDLSLTVFVMNQLTRPGAFETLRKWAVRGAVVSSIAAIAGLVTHFDFYGAMTGLRLYAAFDHRPRGLAFEPRGLGLACAYGLMLILCKQTRTLADWMRLLVVGAGLAASASASALAAVTVGLVVIAIIGSFRIRMAMIVALTGIALLIAGVAAVDPAIIERSREGIEVRITGRGTIQANQAANPAEALAFRMDVFDASASLFLLRNPLYALTGTGPGLISLPASDHIPAGLYKIVFPVINNPPSHGLLLELANTGVLGVTLWFFQVLAIFAAGRRLRGRRGLPFPPKTATAIFLVAAALYAVQVSPSPFWAVTLGLGWAIAEMEAVTARVVKRYRNETTEAPVLPAAASPSAS